MPLVLTEVEEAEYVTPQGAEALTGLSSWFWRRRYYENHIEGAKVAGRLLLPVAAIRRYLAENTRKRSNNEPTREVEAA